MTRGEWNEEKVMAEITKLDSPVGIDAKKTHVMILRELHTLHQRLDRIEARLGQGENP